MLSNGTVINLATVSVEELEKKCSGEAEDVSGKYYADFDSLPLPPSGTKWPTDTKKLFDSLAQFFVRDGKVIALRISWNPYDNQGRPEIGNTKTGNMYTFPLSEAGLIELFGKPTKVIDSFHQ